MKRYASGEAAAGAGLDAGSSSLLTAWIDLHCPVESWTPTDSGDGHLVHRTLGRVFGIIIRYSKGLPSLAEAPRAQSGSLQGPSGIQRGLGPLPWSSWPCPDCTTQQPQGAPSHRQNSWDTILWHP